MPECSSLPFSIDKKDTFRQLTKVHRIDQSSFRFGVINSRSSDDRRIFNAPFHLIASRWLDGEFPSAVYHRETKPNLVRKLWLSNSLIREHSDGITNISFSHVAQKDEKRK